MKVVLDAAPVKKTPVVFDGDGTVDGTAGARRLWTGTSTEMDVWPYRAGRWSSKDVC